MKKFVLGGMAAAVLAAGLAATSVAPASAAVAQPQALSGVTGIDDGVTKVQWRGRGGGYRGGYRGGRGGAGIGLGIAAGALIGGAIASQNGYGYGYGGGYAYGGGPYYAPAPVYVEPGYGGGDEVGYCSQRFKSYDPASGTYLGYDGMRHPCP